MKDKEFLEWLVDRLVFVYKESPNADFVLKLKSIARNTPKNKTIPNIFENVIIAYLIIIYGTIVIFCALKFFGVI